MANRKAKKKAAYSVGRGKPPQTSQFKPGKSGNPKGRPKASKSFAAVLAQELKGRVPVTENGKQRKMSKQQVIAKQLVKKASEGDLKATQTVLKETEDQGDADASTGTADDVDTPEDHLVIADIVRRIRLAAQGLDGDVSEQSAIQNKKGCNS